MNHPLVISLLIRREQCGRKKIIEGSRGLMVHSGPSQGCLRAEFVYNSQLILSVGLWDAINTHNCSPCERGVQG